MANTYLNKTLSGSPTDKNKWTWSAWIKRARLGTEQILFYADDGGSNYYTNLRFNDQDELNFQNRHNNSNDCYLISENKYKDIFGWYHIVLVFDTSNATAADRQIIYVNGERLTSSELRNEQTSTQHRNASINDGYEHRIGRGNNVQGSDYFDGLMSHVHFTDGYAYAASDFGSTDATTGQWKINTAPSVSYGTNGFFILKDGNSVTDQSSNTNNWAVGGGTLTDTKDCPSNAFCTISPLDNMSANNTTVHDGKLRYGNTSFITSDANQIYTRGSIGVKSGKYYWEAKQGNGTAWAIGIMIEAMLTQTNNQFWDTTAVTGVAVNGSSGNLYLNGGQSDSWNTGISVNANTIYGFALDVDNKAFYVSVNGTYLTANSNVGDPTSGSSRTGSVLGELTTRGGTGGLLYIPDDEFIYPFQGDLSSSNYSELSMNFGNGYFGTTAITTNSGNGYAAAESASKFNYQPPTGYKAWNTKGLNS